MIKFKVSTDATISPGRCITKSVEVDFSGPSENNRSLFMYALFAVGVIDIREYTEYLEHDSETTPYRAE